MGVGNTRLAKHWSKIKEQERYMRTSRDSQVEASSWYLSPRGLPRGRQTKPWRWESSRFY